MRPVALTTSTIVRAVLVVLGFWLLYQLLDLVIMLYGAVLVAAIAEPVARWGARYRVPRAVSVIFFYVLVVVLVAGLVGLLVEPVAYQVRQAATGLPAGLQRLSQDVPLIPDINQQTVLRAVEEGLSRFGDNLAQVGSNVFAGTRSVVAGLVNFIFVFVIALYLVVEEDVLPKLVRLISPKAYEPVLLRALAEAERSVGRWLLGQVVLGVIVGMLIGVGLWLLGVPYALLLGVLAGLMELLPAIGPLLAAIPGVAVAFAQSWVLGLLAVGLYAVVGQVESHVLIPSIMRRAVGLRPLVTVVAVLLGARFLGVLGIILAVPTAAIVSIFFKHLFLTEAGDGDLPG